MLIENEDLDLEKIAESGQSFRWTRTGEGGWQVISGNKLLNCRQLEWDKVELDCDDEEFRDYWKNYFDLETDYRAIRKMINPEDSFLSKAAAIGQGIRILKQEAWEMLITFLISQRKSIPAIKGCVEKLCRAAGTQIRGTEFYAFPKAGEIALMREELLQSCGLGYRAKYIYETARKFDSGEYKIEDLEKLNDAELENALMSLYGVGIKVASCTMLFGFHRTDSFPIDVWMNRVLDEYYQNGFEFDRYRPYNGVMQQYLFAYRRSQG